jgi:hypothetical protein
MMAGSRPQNGRFGVIEYHPATHAMEYCVLAYASRLVQSYQACNDGV